MRPRVFPAEDVTIPPTHVTWHCRFNEAAGIPRGRLAYIFMITVYTVLCFNEAAGIPRGRRQISIAPRAKVHSASMRPRVFSAEDLCPARAMYLTVLRFNEAAGIPRGRRMRCCCVWDERMQLQ